MLGDKKRQLVTDYSLVFNSEHGKRVWADLVAHFDLPMLRSNPNLETNKVMFQGGQRSVVLHIHKMLNTDPYAERASHAINEPTNP